jgi:hypothetical protein
MPNSDWDAASTDKKLEMLRVDIQRIYDAVNVLSSAIATTHQTVRSNDSLLKEVAKAVETIEKKMPQAVSEK